MVLLLASSLTAGTDLIYSNLQDLYSRQSSLSSCHSGHVITFVVRA